MTRVLVAEDELKLSSTLEEGLSEAGYTVDVALDGEDALAFARTVSYDAIVLDVLMPRVDGLEVCRRLRSAGSSTPILLLTARDALEHKVDGLDSGADDYLTNLRVADTCEGIADEHLPHIFERFYRADRARSRASGGAGLGLAICARVARLHGGRLDVSSALGQGTTFTLRLPMTAPADVPSLDRPAVAPEARPVRTA